MELYGRFWLTSRKQPKVQFGLSYFMDAIEKYTKYGALEIVNRLQKECAQLTGNTSKDQQVCFSLVSLL